MRQYRTAKIAAAVVLFVILAAGCAKGGGPPSQPTLRLLSTSDVGADWKQRTPSSVPEPGLCGAQQAEGFKPALADAGVVLEAPGLTPAVTELLFWRDVAQTQNLLEEVRRQFQSCTEFTAKASHIVTTIKLSLLDAPILGDEAFSYRESVTGVPFSDQATVDTLLVRNENVLMVLYISSISPDAGLFEMLGEKAFAKAIER